SAPIGALTAELRQTLRQNKQEILSFLRSADSVASQPCAIVPIQSQGSRPPIFGTAGHNGDVFCYRALAHHLGTDQPLFGLRPPGLDNDTPPLNRVEKLAAYFAAEIRAFHPRGEFVIAGFAPGERWRLNWPGSWRQQRPHPIFWPSSDRPTRPR